MRVRPSARQISDMDRAVTWATEHLAKDAKLARLTHCVAFYRARGLDIPTIAKRMKQAPKFLAKEFEEGCSLIAYCLRQHEVPLF